MNFGAFVNLFGSTDGLLHVSEIAWERTERVEDVLKEGDKVAVRVIKIDRGKVEVSMKSLLPKPKDYVEPPRKPRGSFRRSGSRDRGGRDRRDRDGDKRKRFSRDRRDGRDRN